MAQARQSIKQLHLMIEVDVRKGKEGNRVGKPFEGTERIDSNDICICIERIQTYEDIVTTLHCEVSKRSCTRCLYLAQWPHVKNSKSLHT